MAPELPILGTSYRFVQTASLPAELLQSVLPQFAGMKLPQCFAGGRFNWQGADRAL
jgi:hypothetical protein